MQVDALAEHRQLYKIILCLIPYSSPDCAEPLFTQACSQQLPVHMDHLLKEIPVAQ